MLDEQEFARIAPLHTQGIESIKAYREQHGVGLADVAVDEHFQALREAYRQITGVDEPDQNEIRHHRIALYGPPCAACGKPLRTPQARMCAACGADRGAGNTGDRKNDC
ncbi:hypothetical protein F8S13_18195 [Chloroflexia bacterium SDU3-3]|nr:hypothetical protein F8S13_18195 [Chloroflexia bacterium SDU3-3]